MLRSVRARHVIGLTACALAVVLMVPAVAQATPSSHPPKPVVSGAGYEGYASSGSTGGARVTVHGSHFEHVKSVHFGLSAGSDVRVISSHELKVTAPAHVLGEVHVRVTTKVGRSGSTSHNVWDFQQRNSLAGGFEHSCQVLQSTHAARCWGYNDDGQLGNGTITDASLPVSVSGLKHAVSIATGHYFSCSLTASGSVWCWGDNSEGQLGDGTTVTSSTPKRVLGLGARVLDIAAGDLHTCALLVGNRVACWGENNLGQLGDGGTVNRATPDTVHHLSSVADISAGYDFSCAVRTNGTEFCWGDNEYGQLGNGTTTTSALPVQVVGISKAVSTTTADYSTCALTRAGTLRCWGLGEDGELGNGLAVNSTVPVTVSGVTHATSVAAGGFFFCALIHHEVECWGENSNGQLGNGTMAEADAPTAVTGLSKVTAIGAGIYHSLALVSGGRTKAWGYNAKGQLGNDSTTGSSVPVTVG